MRLTPGTAFAWVAHWVPFTARTVFFGSVSLILGPLTPQRSASHWAMRAWSRSCLRFLRISVDVQGVDNVPHGGFAYASNHQSLLDTLLLAATLPGETRWAVKRSLMTIPFLGWHLWLAGHVAVDREGGKRAAVSTVDRFANVLARGKALVVFPEGTRSKDGQVKRFKKGIFYAAVRAGVPVVPVAVHGTGAVMGKGAADMASSPRDPGEPKQRVYVRIGIALAPGNDGPEPRRASELCERTRAAVLSMHSTLEEAEVRACNPEIGDRPCASTLPRS
jgi:1-acyl-sn-glycerol-3-phosphate acyltransferase